MNKFAGFTDEASPNIEGQIAFLKEVGWNGIETRNIRSGVHFDDVSEEEFKNIKGQLDKAGIKIVCYGSQIANWSRPVTADFKKDTEELQRIIPRMHQTGTKLVRVMSYPNDNLPEKQWREEVIRRMKELCRMAEDGGVILAHENCSGYGETPEGTLAMVEAVKSKSFKLIFDTGNPTHHGGDVMEFYQAVKHEVIHIHIKDYVKDPAGDHGCRAVFPGEGLGRIPEIVSMLKKSGYDGWYTMEPHISSVAHAAKEADPVSDPKEVFRKYCRVFEEVYAKA